MNNDRFVPELITIKRKYEIINCPHCGFKVSIKGLDIDDQYDYVCPNCKNVIDKDKFDGILSVPHNHQMPIKCLNCNCTFITNTDDFYYKPGNITCPKCKIKLRRESVIEVFRQYEEKKENSFSYKHPYLAPLIFLFIIFFIVYIFVVLFS